ncbi:4-diphosphocytidyl-2-C-methyl-D-erythritol kinase [Thalassovita gelatinovora]|uniref:4-diphosphocytidyl-2-C-methyl-D-erythritol kinase n=1 Tax=Thalassovita gelatinovora TaxID=53501 RepID=A0A0P1FI40_THAGE|nr:4-(cytidine 5'-diphospho)-2-C-methyl-D-erythritol kinase [Thalassovita gelatinovora]QIZ81895.1 4-(cytidine 5'-diphospho)-2-C-methyl-D-erythritol kinase [Thalassovita gelatinovora]CUH67240.1 4-diphosphocytidyl-2-C-methyl-D-erythritol kinase [Thalassovita gelatinovora]SEP77842.1 4-diphosphocytidyl-2-C-methyl-D-erythritol kinase [Thalassovita gelatinovora]
MASTETFASAKVNLTLHVTGQRADGYHLLDSLVMFADCGDRITLRLSETATLTVSGPKASGVPTGPENLVLRAAGLMRVGAEIGLEKHLPAAAGIGGGSSDAAAVLLAIRDLTGRIIPEQGLSLGADIPVCLIGQAAIMRGIGEDVTVLENMPTLHAVLINPGVPVPTGAVFQGLSRKDNPPMEPLPPALNFETLIGWLGQQRNDLQGPAIVAQPAIGDVLRSIAATAGCRLARMSGSGATCFGLYETADAATKAATVLQRPDWWVQPVRLN